MDYYTTSTVHRSTIWASVELQTQNNVHPWLPIGCVNVRKEVYKNKDIVENG